MTTVTRTRINGKIRIETTSVFEGDENESFQALESQFAAHGVEVMKLGLSELILAHDTDGESLVSGGKKYTSKGRFKFQIQSVYGVIDVHRHVYQTNLGGATRAPLDERLGLIGSCTPDFARILASKSAQMSAAAVTRDMRENHHRPMSDSFSQDNAMRVSALAEAKQAPTSWEKPLLEEHRALDKPVALIVMGVDGAMLNSHQGGWRQAQAGTICFYDTEGELADTLFVGGGPGETPAEGKVVFFKEMKATLKRVKAIYPLLPVVSISDAASDFRTFLQENSTDWLVDYHHAAEYITKAAETILDSDKESWAREMRRVLKKEAGGAERVLRSLEAQAILIEGDARISTSAREGFNQAITYFTNHHKNMNYQEWQDQGRPIGSGPTEAACKTLLKARMTQSGMRWSMPSAHAIIWLRALHRTRVRWEAFWKRHGLAAKAMAL